MAYTDMERRILDMWPKFEGGEPVMPGDKVHYASTHNVETEIEVESITMMDGLFVLCDGECRSNQYEQGQRVKRPAPKVLDADGVEIKVGDTVYSIRTGAKCKVEGIEGDGVLKTDDEYGLKWRIINSHDVTHKQPVRDMDGVLIEVGDTVWHEDGSEWLVEELNRYGVRCFDGAKRRTFSPTFLTHTSPESWERLEKDIPKSSCDYFGFVGKDCDGCPAYKPGNCSELKAADIIRRAKALAEKEAEK